MPPLALHTLVVRKIADRLRHRVLDAERGHLYLGCTAPDIRVITRWDRSATHFFDLASFERQSSVAELFRHHHYLAQVGRLGQPTVAFMAGYISHLVMDEIWITDIYRPFFGEQSPLGGAPWANLLDRALQFALDDETRGDSALMADVLQELSCGELTPDVGFIDSDTLGHWRQILIDVLDQLPDRERFLFRFIASRYPGLQASPMLAEFLRNLPDMVEETKNYLTRERIQTFMEDSVTQGLAATKEYLQCV
jgi:hypothetical protein